MQAWICMATIDAHSTFTQRRKTWLNNNFGVTTIAFEKYSNTAWSKTATEFVITYLDLHLTTQSRSISAILYN